MIYLSKDIENQEFIFYTTKNYYEFFNDMDFIKKNNIKINRDTFNSITLIKISMIQDNKIIGELIKRIMRNYN